MGLGAASAAKVVATACGALSDVGVLPRERMSRYEIDMVRDRRTRFRAGWQTCANIVGRSVHDVRVACDPDYTDGDTTSLVAVSKPQLKEFSDLQLRILDLMAKRAAQTGRWRLLDMTPTLVASELAVGRNVVGRDLRDLGAKGLLMQRRIRERVAWSFTITGKAFVEGQQ